MAGGKGGSQTETFAPPTYLENAIREGLSRGQQVADLGYMPRYGVDVAGLTPMQQMSMQNVANQATAFGLLGPTDVMAGMPPTQTSGGFTGYSSGDVFDVYAQNLRERRPQQYAGYMGLFNTDPYGVYDPTQPPPQVTPPPPSDGMPSIYTNPERAAEVAQNYADGYMGMGGEESPYARPTASQINQPTPQPSADIYSAPIALDPMEQVGVPLPSPPMNRITDSYLQGRDQDTGLTPLLPLTNEVALSDKAVANISNRVAPSPQPALPPINLVPQDGRLDPRAIAMNKASFNLGLNDPYRGNISYNDLMTRGIY